MDFIRAFNTSALEIIFLVAVILGGIYTGKKIRDKKDAKDAGSSAE